MNNNGIYIYGIVPNFYPLEQFNELKKMGLTVVPFQNISAIVAESPVRTLDNLSRESLAQMLVHHQRTIEKLMEQGFSMILPMRLATIVESNKEVWNVLETGYELILTTLKKIENMTEIDVVVTWDDLSDALDEVALLPEIVNRKLQLQNKPGGATQADMVEMGLLVKQHIDAKKTDIQQTIFSKLAPLVFNQKSHEVMNDQMVANTAFLIEKSNAEKFEAIIEALDEEYNGYLNFKLVGPLPCYSFYTLELSTMSFAQIEEARKQLELPEIFSETDIRKSYLEKVKTTHPDTNSNQLHQDSFNAANQAYQTLLTYSSTQRRDSGHNPISFNQTEHNQDILIIKIRE